jgi:hypothetical protein
VPNDSAYTVGKAAEWTRPLREGETAAPPKPKPTDTKPADTTKTTDGACSPTESAFSWPGTCKLRTDCPIAKGVIYSGYCAGTSYCCVPHTAPEKKSCPAGQCCPPDNEKTWHGECKGASSCANGAQFAGHCPGADKCCVSSADPAAKPTEPTKRTTYVLVAGDTGYLVARRLGITFSALKEMNAQVTDWADLAVGAHIFTSA